MGVEREGAVGSSTPAHAPSAKHLQNNRSQLPPSNPNRPQVENAVRAIK